MPKAEGGERTAFKGSYRLSVIRGGQSIEYFDKYPNASGVWIPKLN